MKIALFISNLPQEYIDLKNGNPGMGGTKYEMFLLAQLLESNKDFEFKLFLTSETKLCKKFEIVKGVLEAVEKADKEGFEVIIVKSSGLFAFLKEKHNIRVLLWCHNFLSPKQVLALNSKKNKTETEIICVSNEQKKILSSVLKTRKIYTVFNCFPNFNNYSESVVKEKACCFVGSLTKDKHFDIAIKEFAKAYKKNNELKMYVIGDSNLYGYNKDAFKNSVFNYIKNNELNDCIIFCGKMGLEKYDIINRCKLGIVNPDPTDETFCIAALDYASCCVPIACKNVNGLVDTTKNFSHCYYRKTTTIHKAISKYLVEEKYLGLIVKSNFETYSVTNFLNSWKNVFAKKESDCKKLSFFKKIILASHYMLDRIKEKKYNV